VRRRGAHYRYLPDLIMNGGDVRLRVMASQISKAFKPKTMAHWRFRERRTGRQARRRARARVLRERPTCRESSRSPLPTPAKNCVDVYAQDLDWFPHDTTYSVTASPSWWAAGLGRSYVDADTFARLADPLTFVTYDEVEGLIKAVLATYRDLGDRSRRKRARMKYVVADEDSPGFRSEVEQRYGLGFTRSRRY